MVTRELISETARDSIHVYAGTIVLLENCNQYDFTILMNNQTYKSDEYPELYEIFKDYIPNA